MLAILVEHLYTVGRGNIKAAGGIEATAVAARALPLCQTGCIEVGELALITELTVRAHVKNDQRSRIGNNDVLLIGRQNNPVGVKAWVSSLCVLFSHLPV